MKHLLPIILSILLLTACGENERNSQFLERAENIMNDSCDVALSMLQDSINPKTLTTERGRAIYAVLLSQALDKNYIDIASDLEYNTSIADFAVDVQDDQSAKSFVTPCSCAGRFLSLWRCLYGVYVYCGSRSEMEYIE